MQPQRSFEVSIVDAEKAEINVQSPVQHNGFWKQFQPRRFAAYCIKEIVSRKVYYIATPFRTEANLVILHFKVPYEYACRYLSENAQDVARLENSPLLKLLENDHEWAAGALWFMEYTKSDLGSQGNSHNGDYPELCMTFTATDNDSKKAIAYQGKYTIASVVASAYFPSISAKLLLNNHAAIVAGRMVAGFDKHWGMIDVSTIANGVRFVVRPLGGDQVFAIEVPTVGTYESLRNQIRLFKETIRLYGTLRALISALRMILRMIPGIRDLITADRCDGYTTLNFPFNGMPRRLRMDSDMNPWSFQIAELSNEVITHIDPEDRMFGALLLHAEFETMVKAKFRGAFALAEAGSTWLRYHLGTVVEREDSALPETSRPR